MGARLGMGPVGLRVGPVGICEWPRLQIWPLWLPRQRRVLDWCKTIAMFGFKEALLPRLMHPPHVTAGVIVTSVSVSGHFSVVCRRRLNPASRSSTGGLRGYRGSLGGPRLRRVPTQHGAGVPALCGDVSMVRQCTRLLHWSQRGISQELADDLIELGMLVGSMTLRSSRSQSHAGVLGQVHPVDLTWRWNRDRDDINPLRLGNYYHVNAAEPHWWVNTGSGNGLVPVRQQAITWANVDPDLCQHMGHWATMI